MNGGRRRAARVPRLHVDAALVAGETLALPQAPSRHLLEVLRARAGDPVCLFNGDGHDYPAELVEGGRVARLHVAARLVNARESPFELTLVQGVSRGDRMDATVRQAVELGVARIVPVRTRLGRVALDERRAAKRHAHWRAIVVSACEQCGRARLPSLEPLDTLEGWLDRFDAGAGAGLVLAPDAERGIGDASLDGHGATLLVGPESGLDGAEIETAERAGLRAVRFGPRVLRTETAGPAALAVLQARHGDLGG